MSRDPLDVLARLRRIEVKAAQRDLALRLREAAEAETVSRLARDSIQREAALASEPAGAALFRHWLPFGREMAQAAHAAHQVAEQQSGAARARLATTHAAARAVELLQAERVRMARLAELRAEQVGLDEQAARSGALPGRSAQ